MKIEIDVPSERIAGIMTTAIESSGMTRQWCAGVYWQTESATPPLARQPGGVPWYANPRQYEGDFQVEVVEIIDESKEATGTNLRRHICRSAEFASGLALMAREYGRHFGDMMKEDGDEITGDVFLQCVALGEVIYG